MQAGAPNFWDDQEKAQKVLRRRTGIEQKLELIESLGKELGDAADYFELAMAEEDAEALADLPVALEFPYNCPACSFNIACRHINPVDVKCVINNIYWIDMKTNDPKKAYTEIAESFEKILLKIF